MNPRGWIVAGIAVLILWGGDGPSRAGLWWVFYNSNVERQALPEADQCLVSGGAGEAPRWGSCGPAAIRMPLNPQPIQPLRAAPELPRDLPPIQRPRMMMTTPIDITGWSGSCTSTATTMSGSSSSMITIIQPSNSYAICGVR